GGLGRPVAALAARGDQIGGDAGAELGLFHERRPKFRTRRAGLGIAVAEGGDALHRRRRGFIEPGLLFLLGGQEHYGQSDPEYDPEQKHDALPPRWLSSAAAGAIARSIADKGIAPAKPPSAIGGKIIANFMPFLRARRLLAAGVNSSLANGLEDQASASGRLLFVER